MAQLDGDVHKVVVIGSHWRFSSAGSFANCKVASLNPALNGSLRHIIRVTNVPKSTQFFFNLIKLTLSQVFIFTCLLLLSMLNCNFIDEYSSSYEKMQLFL